MEVSEAWAIIVSIVSVFLALVAIYFSWSFYRSARDSTQSAQDVTRDIVQKNEVSAETIKSVVTQLETVVTDNVTKVIDSLLQQRGQTETTLLGMVQSTDRTAQTKINEEIQQNVLEAQETFNQKVDQLTDELRNRMPTNTPFLDFLNENSEFQKQIQTAGKEAISEAGRAESVARSAALRDFIFAQLRPDYSLQPVITGFGDSFKSAEVEEELAALKKEELILDFTAPALLGSGTLGSVIHVSLSVSGIDEVLLRP